MALAFEITAPIAMFRRPYTTTSSISFPLPPPTAVAGLIAGIVGVNNGSDIESFSAAYWDEMAGTQIAVSVLNRIAWYTAAVNFWNLKEPQKSPHIRVKHQFIKNPKYRIYVNGGIEGRLCKHLSEGTFVYTPCLGTAYAIADIYYLGDFEKKVVNEKRINLSSVLPLLPDHNVKVDILSSGGVFRDNLPYRLSKKRALYESVTTLYSTLAKEGICLTEWEGLDVTYYRDECIAWFPAW